MAILNNNQFLDTNESDTESDIANDSQFYHPISSSDPDDTEDNDISSLDLNGEEGVSASEEEEEEIVEERDASIFRAFSEDESRRSAPLTSEVAARILSVMRGVSLPDYTPEWADRVPEERWLDQLRRLRGK